MPDRLNGLPEDLPMEPADNSIVEAYRTLTLATAMVRTRRARPRGFRQKVGEECPTILELSDFARRQRQRDSIPIAGSKG